MRVTIAGSGDAFGSGGRFQACTHIAPSHAPAILIDCGTTSLTALRSLDLDPGEVTLVAVTHLHGDHFGGLPFLVLDGQFRRRTTDLRIIGPPGTRRRLTETMEALFPGSSTVTRRFTTVVDEIAPDETLSVPSHGLHIEAHPADHSAGAPALSLRLTLANRTLAFSGDTAWTPTLPEVAADSDLFLCEGYTWGRKVPGHMEVTDLVNNRETLNTTRLLLTHPSPGVLDQQATLPFELASDGTTVDIPDSPPPPDG
ncbi:MULTISPECIES: MBL fold metallo-hydrolase [Streptomyces]|uniref:Beta-lactamase domain-containing protein n=1 Tax=Streptomyces sviceus (strain ATCC 29083 / DSM 924 / JCM 4929 / NBRC 13980 / NCIMB 11184 / NRRL 5439 / UC 5370) TaxID=463191 RepID=B5I8Y4_STRX2|nr:MULTISPECIES: MBL fold metallo-hydrolase [Streptomyces]EDY61539.1 beta-lactamase domain-containing protein [Streptomyces sviceus ATCC 29083]MYT03279.1 MBL fold metallo-hydrolase [Streptomyces sp. SID5470]